MLTFFFTPGGYYIPPSVKISFFGSPFCVSGSPNNSVVCKKKLGKTFMFFLYAINNYIYLYVYMQKHTHMKNSNTDLLLIFNAVSPSLLFPPPNLIFIFHEKWFSENKNHKTKSDVYFPSEMVLTQNKFYFYFPCEMILTQNKIRFLFSMINGSHTKQNQIFIFHEKSVLFFLKFYWELLQGQIIYLMATEKKSYPPPYKLNCCSLIAFDNSGRITTH